MENATTSQEGLATASTGLVDSSAVEQKTSELLDKHASEPKRKRGPYKKRTAQAQPDVAANAPTVPSFSVDKELIKRCVFAVAQAIDQVVTRSVYKKTLLIGGDKDMATDFANNVALTKVESEVMGECVGAIVEKYELLGRYAPEVMLMAVTVTYGVRVVTVLRKLDYLAARASRKKSSDATQPSPE